MLTSIILKLQPKVCYTMYTDNPVRVRDFRQASNW